LTGRLYTGGAAEVGVDSGRAFNYERACRRKITDGVEQFCGVPLLLILLTGLIAGRIDSALLLALR
jgi:hypothetical protein